MRFAGGSPGADKGCHKRLVRCQGEYGSRVLRTKFTSSDYKVPVASSAIQDLNIQLQQIGCVTMKLSDILTAKAELEIMQSQGNSLSVNLVSNCPLDAFLVSVTWEDPELLVTVSSLQSSAGSKVGVAKLSGALDRLPSAWPLFLSGCTATNNYLPRSQRPCSALRRALWRKVKQIAVT
eukprot:g13698.t1